MKGLFAEIEEVRALLRQAAEEKCVLLDNYSEAEADFEKEKAALIAKSRQSLDEEAKRLGDIVRKHLNVAQKHTSLRAQSLKVSPKQPDLDELKSRSFQVIDAGLPEDPNAAEMVRLCASYLAYIDLMIQTGGGTVSEELDALNGRFQKMEADHLQALVKIDKNVENRISEMDILSRLSENAVAPGGENVLLGKAFFSFSSDLDEEKLLQKVFGKIYDSVRRSISIDVPAFDPEISYIMISYTPGDAGLIERLVPSVCCAFLQKYSVSGSEVRLLDSVYYNDRLYGPLSEATGGYGSRVHGTPTGEDAMRKEFGILSGYIRGISEKIGYLTAEKYNEAHPEDPVPHALLILHESDRSALPLEYSSEFQSVLNNAERCGVMILWLKQSGASDGGWRSSAFDDAVTRFPGGILLRSNSARAGDFLLGGENSCDGFVFSDVLPYPTISEVAKLREEMQPEQLGNKYLERYPVKLPARSAGMRSSIEIPVALDDHGEPVVINFDGVNFAAYIMGSAGSGKSTMLHTMIAGFCMNYHPDELELWLADFNKVEFSAYIRHPLPNVRYILLDDSRELVFDLMDRLYSELERRQEYLSYKGVQDITSLPPEDYLPAIVVIIDEFARMSNVLASDTDINVGYKSKMTELLQAGRKVGFKFIFASQNYNDGIRGLTDEAKNQIQTRIAMMNPERTEVYGCLAVSRDQLTPDMEDYVDNLPKYHSVIKQNGTRGYTLCKASNLDIDSEKEMPQMADHLFGAMKAVEEVSADPLTYRKKDVVFLDGAMPRTFRGHLEDIRAYEADHEDDLLPGDISMYPGTPRGLSKVKRFTLIPRDMENILVLGGGTDAEGRMVLASLLTSLIKSYERSYQPVEIWSDDRDPVYFRHHDLWETCSCYTDKNDICDRIRDLRDACSMGNQSAERLVILLGFDSLLRTFSHADQYGKQVEYTGEPDLFSVMNACNVAGDAEAESRLIGDYNDEVAKGRETAPGAESGFYNATSDLQRLLTIGGECGIHFVLCVPNPDLMDSMPISEDLFLHRIYFKMPYGALRRYVRDKVDFLNLETGIGFYQYGTEDFSFRTHLYDGPPIGGWKVAENGEDVTKGG
ncbi:MAG: hypothetical protein K5697_13500 [Lachnospiraceae bacterium]|nr:hypothetical protein [Lachnospiraceae bacterium]